MNKRGISIVIGYILLVAITITMSLFVYQWLKTYVPKESIKCSEGTSVFIKSISYNCTSKKLDMTLKNNGKFSVAGFFIYASNISDTDAVATIDLSKNVTNGELYGNAVIYIQPIGDFENWNALTPNEPSNTKYSSFDVSDYGTLYKIEIVPVRWQEVEGKKKFISCTDARIKEILVCED